MGTKLWVDPVYDVVAVHLLTATRLRTPEISVNSKDLFVDAVLAAVD
jgi:hypothetical protein